MADLKGLKRICMSCGARFYDLNKKPIVCPSCSTEFTGEIKVKSRRGRLPVDDDAGDMDTEDSVVTNADSTEIETDEETVSLDEIEEDGDEGDEESLPIDEDDLPVDEIDDLDDDDGDDVDEDIAEDDDDK